MCGKFLNFDKRERSRFRLFYFNSPFDFLCRNTS